MSNRPTLPPSPQEIQTLSRVEAVLATRSLPFVALLAAMPEVFDPATVAVVTGRRGQHWPK